MTAAGGIALWLWLIGTGLVVLLGTSTASVLAALLLVGVLRGTLRQTLYAGDATSGLLEELQFTLGEGACMDAARTGRPVLVPDVGDVTESARWPFYAAAVVERAGVGAVFALPLQWATINLGCRCQKRRTRHATC